MEFRAGSASRGFVVWGAQLQRLALAALAAILVAAPASPADPPREVNVTTESTPGWAPSVELEEQARAAAARFFDARDHGRYAEAYAMLSEFNRSDPPDTFAKRATAFNATAGALKDRRVTKLTWSKDPKSAPAPGVYAAVDFVGHFAGVDRYCGYLVLHQTVDGGPFRVMRSVEASVDNATAAAIVQKQSAAALAAAWTEAARGCPNYQPPIEEARDSTIGYPTVAAALAALRAKPGVKFTTQGGWTIADDESTGAIWSFSPPGYPAYPAAVRRQVRQQGGQVQLGMDIQCEASKAACDDLVREFQKLNERAVGSTR